MRDRWAREQVVGLAPDAAAAKAAGGVAKPGKWGGTGCDDEAVWGECQGSGKSVYRTCADLTEPAFRCTCPSRKFPCKHALGLLLLWSDGVVEGAPRPAWVAEWVEERRARADRAAERRASTAAKARDPKTVERRERRVDDGLAELDQWLRDQVAHGLAQAEKAPYRLWDDAARRLATRRRARWPGRCGGSPRSRAGPGGLAGCWRSTRCCGCSYGPISGGTSCQRACATPFGRGSGSPCRRRRCCRAGSASGTRGG
ncbi:SWIM zinc finger family protein [Actinomadura sp. BRA 177]|uniref:SWIM zinc finger family protein n=1 Tax=Actinomadura sp. BRA 177 TaxID=2745202 RepID=UPI00281666AB|nr:SWIM zinc finger family protein [Actinomadura sp. BRA 177]